MCQFSLLDSDCGSQFKDAVECDVSAERLNFLTVLLSYCNIPQLHHLTSWLHQLTSYFKVTERGIFKLFTQLVVSFGALLMMQRSVHFTSSIHNKSPVHILPPWDQ